MVTLAHYPIHNSLGMVPKADNQIGDKMKIMLCGNGVLNDEVAAYFTVGKVYDVVCVSNFSEVYSVVGDDGLIHNPAIFSDGQPCAYLQDCYGNLFWKIVEEA